MLVAVLRAEKKEELVVTKPKPLFQQMDHLLEENSYYMIGIIDFLQEYDMRKKAEVFGECDIVLYLSM